MSFTLQEGALFAGRYRILRRIAAGGMGAVYEVLHLETERRRALKVMLPHMLESDDFRDRFKREAKIAARIESDFIVDVFDAGIEEATQTPFLVMELLRGEDLKSRLKRVGRLPPEEVVTYLQHTAMALDKTHKASIVHRDLKPENLFLAERDDGPPRIKVLDFGVAKILAESATAGATQSIGTPLYMAPEQFNPSASLTGATDIYALGMVAYTLLAGAPYWSDEARGGNIYAIAAVAMNGPREPASVRAAARGVKLPPSFDAWFGRVTAVSPASRFSTAPEAVHALSEALGLAPPPRGSSSRAVSGVFCFGNVDGNGASGGGGGAGGCGGKGGGGGKAGGSSIAIISLGTKLALTDVALSAGNGGVGGAGVVGQGGGAFGIGAIGGAASGMPGSKPGCQGGNGGLGGDGGPGGGGRGGHAIGLAYVKAPSAVPMIKTFTPGLPGNGGKAGPMSTNDGALGAAGQCWDFTSNTPCGQ